MPYNARLDHTRREHAVAQAERRWHSSPAPLGFAYRVTDASYSVSDEYGDHAYSDSAIELEAFPVLKRTENGFRIRTGGWDHSPSGRWIAFAWTKRFASLTVDEALQSFIARKTRQATIHEARAQCARRLAERAERMLDIGNPITIPA